MKIVITAQGDSLESPLDPRFGRAKMFVLFDTETEKIEVIGNQQNMNAAQGAGIQSAQNVVRAGAQAVITGHCGPKAFRTLSAAGVSVYCSSASTVGEAVSLFKNGELKKTETADVEGHW
jgi:predicted Fe-Mo cluster-binding NifX family protein